jgi:hypothetical protein
VPPANTLLFQLGTKPPYPGLPFSAHLIQAVVQILYLTEQSVCLIALALDLLLRLVGAQDNAVPLILEPLHSGLEARPVGVHLGMPIGQSLQFIEHGGDIARHADLIGLGMVGLGASFL